MGSILTAHKDFSQEDSTFFVRLVNRWRLEPGERVGDKTRPVTPITFYIDPNVPATVSRSHEGRRRGVERGVREPPAGAARSARSICPRMPIRKTSGTRRCAGTCPTSRDTAPSVPSTVDPRTAEILDADILFEASMFAGFRNTWRDVMRHPLGRRKRSSRRSVSGRSSSRRAVARSRDSRRRFAAQGSLLRAALVARGRDRAGPGGSRCATSTRR